MLVTSLILFALTAYYFGMRAGMIVGGTSLVLLLGAIAMPSKALLIYALVGVTMFAVLAIGPRRKSTNGKVDFLRTANTVRKKWRDFRRG